MCPQAGCFPWSRPMPHTHASIGQGGQISYIDALLQKPFADLRDFGALEANPDNSAEIQAAIDSLEPVKIASERYDYATTLILREGSTLIGQNYRDSHLRYTGVGHGITEPANTRINHLNIGNFSLSSNNGANAGVALFLQEYASYSRFEHLYLEDWGVGGIYLGGGLANFVTKNYIKDCCKAVGGFCYGIQLNRSTFTDDRMTTTRLVQNYISGMTNTSLDAVGIVWEDTYKCQDIDNIIEDADIGHDIRALNAFFALIRPYYEDDTLDLMWKDTEGRMEGENDPNLIAVWTGATHVDFRVIPFLKWYGHIGDGGGHESVFGSLISHGLVDIQKDLNVAQKSSLDPPGAGLTIDAGGLITVTKSYHLIIPRGGAVDDLTDINGGIDGMELTLKSDGTFIITVKSTGNIHQSAVGDFIFNTTRDRLTLKYDATLAHWCEISRSNN